MFFTYFQDKDSSYWKNTFGIDESNLKIYNQHFSIKSPFRLYGY
jgi:hypothetical protein